MVFYLESTVAGEFPPKRASDVESVFIVMPRRLHATTRSDFGHLPAVYALPFSVLSIATREVRPK